MERKTVKIRVYMYSDTKFKIIDTMEDRDLIHYIWTRLLTLAGKVNLEGELYLSKNIPYSIETLALEFNRSAKKVALALKVFMDLEMVELTKNNVYKVRNFSKHQNIKKKNKEDFIDKSKIIEVVKGGNEEKIATEAKAFNEEKFVNEDINKDKIETVNNTEGEAYKCGDINSIINEKIKVSAENKDNIDSMISNKDKYNKGDKSKKEIEKNKVLNDTFIISNEDKCNDINVAVNSDVEKIKKDSNFKVVDFNSNNKIKNDDNYVNQNNNMKDNNVKDKIKIKNKNDTTDLKGNNVMNYSTEDKENNNEVAFREDKKTANKDILDNEFVFSKAKCKKKKVIQSQKRKRTMLMKLFVT